MPLNESLQKIKHTVPNWFDVQEKTKFLCLEEHIHAKLVEGSYKNWKDLESYIPTFVNATWGIRDDFTPEERTEIVQRTFMGEHLPGALETVQFTFLLTGMTLQEVTHILRHREFVFSARSTGDRFLCQDNIMVPEAIMNSEKILEKYTTACLEQVQIYQDAIDTGKITNMDARYLLPKATEQQYFMSGNFRAFMKFIAQRKDVQIQTHADNLLVYDMIKEFIRIYPKLKPCKIFRINDPDMFYVKNARKAATTNLFPPEKCNDIFEWRKDDFVYDHRREWYNGTDITTGYCYKNHFVKRKQELQNLLKTFSLSAIEKANSKEIKEKTRQTNLEKYGVEYPFQSKKIQEKVDKSLRDSKGNRGWANKAIRKSYDTTMRRNVYKFNNKLIRFIEDDDYATKLIVDMNYPTLKEVQSKLDSESQQILRRIKNLDLQSKLSKKYDAALPLFRKLEKIYNNKKITREFEIKTDEGKKYRFDIKIDDVLIEVNPSFTHSQNGICEVFDYNELEEDYHLKKTLAGFLKGYKVYNVWDWDSEEIILNDIKSLLENKPIKYGNIENNEILMDFNKCQSMFDDSWKIDSFSGPEYKEDVQKDKTYKIYTAGYVILKKENNDEKI